MSTSATICPQCCKPFTGGVSVNGGPIRCFQCSGYTAYPVGETLLLQTIAERDRARAVAAALEEELTRRVEAGDRMAEVLAVDCLARHFRCFGSCLHGRARAAWKAIGAEA